MTTGLVSYQNVDEIFEKTARAIFEAIKPRILLLGGWDDHFANISKLYQWSEHKQTVPKNLGSNIALVVTNSQKHLRKILDRAHPYTAVLVYDESRVIPVATRTNSDLFLVAYLRSVSDRFIRGHVRTLLQLQKHFIDLDGDIPIIVTQEGARLTIDHLFQALDVSKMADVNCDHVDTFFSCFSAFAALTSYESPILVESPKLFTERVKRTTKTAVLVCRKKSDKAAYERFNLKRKAVVFLHDYAQAKPCDLDLVGIGRRKADYYLTAYFISLQKNLGDRDHQTRFMQPGDIDRVIAGYPVPREFCSEVRSLLDGTDLRFRNIAPKVNNVDFSAQPLNELIGRLDKAVYAELFAQCDNALDTAQMVSGIAQSTLHAKK